VVLAPTGQHLGKALMWAGRLLAQAVCSSISVMHDERYARLAL